jgi:phenylacetate-CoA ligase
MTALNALLVKTSKLLDNVSDAYLTYKGIRFHEKFLKHSQYFSEEQLTNYKKKWLKNLLIHCYYKIPWYSKQFRYHGCDPFSDNPFLQLSKLPILSKDTVRLNHADFCLSNASTSSMKFTTSGTTGEPLVSYTSKNQWVNEQGIIWRHWKSAGYQFRDKIAIFRSYSPKKSEPLMKNDKLRNWVYFSVFNMDDNVMSLYAKFLQKWKPRYLRGYPSSLLLVAEHAIRFGWKLPSLKGAFVASESLPSNIMEKLKEAFDIPIFDHYGQAEITCMFHNCKKHDGMHVDWEYGHVDLVPISGSTQFRIIATNLHNYSMPLLRYDTGDLSDGDWIKCSCGLSSPKINAILGRKDDYIILKDNTKLTTVNLYTYFSKISYIRRFQIVQYVRGEIEVHLSFWNEAKIHPDENEIIDNIRTQLSQITGLIVKIKYPANWIQSKEGKFATFNQKIV